MTAERKNNFSWTDTFFTQNPLCISRRSNLRLGFNIFQQFLALSIALSLSASSFAQAKKPVSNTAGKPTAAATCSGAWTGNITYSKRISSRNEKTVDRVSTRGKDKKKWEMNYRYTASVAVVEAPERDGYTIGKA